MEGAVKFVGVVFKYGLYLAFAGKLGTATIEMAKLAANTKPMSMYKLNSQLVGKTPWLETASRSQSKKTQKIMR